MYKKFHIYNKRLYPFIRNMLDTNRQKYTKNNAIIKRKLSYSTPPPPQQPNKWPYYMLFLSPLALNFYHHLKR